MVLFNFYKFGIRYISYYYSYFIKGEIYSVLSLIIFLSIKLWKREE